MAFNSTSLDEDDDLPWHLEESEDEEISKLRLLTFIITGLAIIGAVIFAVWYINNPDKVSFSAKYTAALVSMLVVAGGLIFASVLRYLSAPTPTPAYEPALATAKMLNGVKTETARLKKSLSELRRQVAQGRAGTEQIGMTEAIIADLTEQSKGEILKELKNEITAVKLKNEINHKISDNFDSITIRLSSEIASLAKRGNLNLAIGITSTVIGIFLLSYFVFSTQSNQPDIYQFISHFLPRISLVLFVQLFAFFFLNLYKASLSDIKYYQNELTNIQSRKSALSVLAENDLSENSSLIISELLKTDRNNSQFEQSKRLESENINTAVSILNAISPLLKKGD